MDAPVATASVESALFGAVMWIRLTIEALGVTIITAGVASAVWRMALHMRRGQRTGFQKVRLSLAHSLALALEFELAADLLGTAVSPSWDQLGKLATIAVIRTGLNYFLTQEIQPVHGRPEIEKAAAGFTG